MSSAAPAVSVLITAYNREGFIGAAIESVLAQTWSNFELLVVDDASSDGTAAIARDYAARDRRIRVSVNERNLGDYPNRNRAATLASGTFLKYHDSDDVMYPHCLQTMTESLGAFPDAGFALTAHRSWDGGPVPMLINPADAYRREFLGSGMFMVGPSCAMFRRGVFETLGRFPEAGPHSDHLFWLTACRSVNVLLLPADLFWWRTHAGQHLRTPQALFDGVHAERHAWEALMDINCPLQGDELDQARRNQVCNLAKLLRRDLCHGRWGLLAYRLRHSGPTPRDWMRYFRGRYRAFANGHSS
jgi:glycosyl transferase family 2